MAGNLLLSRGQIIDGTGAPARVGDVLLRNGKIADMGPKLEVSNDTERIDCSGAVIAPGFIDLHSHSDLHVVNARKEKLRQGVTTEVVGNCGFSAFPMGEDSNTLRSFAHSILCGEGEWGWNSAKQYLAAAHEPHLPVCGESLVGHGSLRVAVAGMQPGALNTGQLERMLGLIQEAFEEGAVGLSTGLMYAPGSEADRAELLALCRLTARYGKLYTTHMRDYGFHLLDAIDEQVELAYESGCRLQISHLQAVGKQNRSLNQKALERVEAARLRGIDIAFDCYPYIAGSTVMTQLLPQSALAGGVDALLGRLAEPAQRVWIAQAVCATIANSWDELVVSSVASQTNRDLVGRNIEEIAELCSIEPIEAVFRIIEQERGAALMIEFNQSEENLRQNLAHPLSSIISDGFYVEGRPHPRLYGTFPSFLRMALDRSQWISIEEAVRKITSAPAARIGCTDRGILRIGAQADITIFDPSLIASPATFEAPEQNPVGILHVLRNGVRHFSSSHPETP